MVGADLLQRRRCQNSNIVKRRRENLHFVNFNGLSRVDVTNAVKVNGEKCSGVKRFQQVRDQLGLSKVGLDTLNLDLGIIRLSNDKRNERESRD
jgi:ribosomal protein L36